MQSTCHDYCSSPKGALDLDQIVHLSLQRINTNASFQHGVKQCNVSYTFNSRIIFLESARVLMESDKLNVTSSDTSPTLSSSQPSSQS